MRLPALKRLVAVVAAGTLGLMVSCAAAPKAPSQLHPEWENLEIETIGLAPVLFLDQALDSYYQGRAGEEIHRQARRVLEDKGYQVLALAMPEGEALSPSQEFGQAYNRRVAAFAPPEADAVMVIRVDHFLDAGVQGGKGLQFLDIYATAALIARESADLLWLDEGHGSARGSFLSPLSLHMELFFAPAELAHSLFDTLPNAGTSAR